MERKFSRRTVWIALDSEYGERLNEIMNEHVKLAHQLIMNWKLHCEAHRLETALKIEKLRREREFILLQFEGVNTCIGG